MAALPESDNSWVVQCWAADKEWPAHMEAAAPTVCPPGRKDADCRRESAPVEAHIGHRSAGVAAQRVGDVVGGDGNFWRWPSLPAADGMASAPGGACSLLHVPPDARAKCSMWAAGADDGGHAISDPPAASGCWRDDDGAGRTSPCGR